MKYVASRFGSDVLICILKFTIYIHVDRVRHIENIILFLNKCLFFIIEDRINIYKCNPLGELNYTH